MRSVLTAPAICLLAYAGLLHGTVRRVPQEYGTIQAALDSLQDGDTVLVAVGTYEEALVAPSRSNFVLRGDVQPDTGDFPRPTIDPSTLPRPDTVACLITHESSFGVTIEDMAFRNGREMYDSIPRPVGGIANHSENLTLRRCVFDSTYIGVSGGTGLVLEDCDFELNRTYCARTDSGPIQAVNCVFSCNGGGGQNVSARSHSTFRNCWFRDNRGGHLLVALGDSILIEDCIFGPYGPLIFNPVEIGVRSGCIIRRNLFVDCGLGQAILNILTDCSNNDSMPVLISQNIFRNYYGGEGQGGFAVQTLCEHGNPPAYFGILEDNVFEDGTSSPLFAPANAIHITGRMYVRRNRFTRLDPPDVPDVNAYRVNSGIMDTLILRDNLFDPVGSAASASLARIDARWNWWGHESGPYHPVSNPNGQGGEVGDNVLFEPWHADTTFVDTPVRNTPSVASNALRVSPNPFNAEIELRLTIPGHGRFVVEMFDLLGRKVDNLWRGEVNGEQLIHYRTEQLSSGIYFVRAREENARVGSVMEKVVLIR